MTADAGPRISVVESTRDLEAVLGEPAAGGAVILVGGADGLQPELEDRLVALFDNLADALGRIGGAMVDGGTESGIMRLVGQARARRGGTFRLIGVAPRGKVDPEVGGEEATATIAAGHPELVLVPGTAFGEETPWLFAAGDYLCRGVAPTIVVNGGQLTLDEAETRLAAGAAVIAVEDTGRAADYLLGKATEGSFDPVDPAILRSPALTAVSTDTSAAEWASIIATTVSEGRGR